jgi:hypothetical protein
MQMRTAFIVVFALLAAIVLCTPLVAAKPSSKLSTKFRESIQTLTIQDLPPIDASPLADEEGTAQNYKTTFHRSRMPRRNSSYYTMLMCNCLRVVMMLNRSTSSSLT